MDEIRSSTAAIFRAHARCLSIADGASEPLISIETSGPSRWFPPSVIRITCLGGRV